MRSLLIVPVDPPRALLEAAVCGADALVIDFAGVTPRSAIPAALDTLASMLCDIGGSAERPRLYARINAFATGLVDEDLAWLSGAWCDGVMLPRVVGAPDIQRLGAKLAVWEAENDIAEGRSRILAVAGDTARGLLAVGTVPDASPRLSGIVWSAADLVADLGGTTHHAGEDAAPCRHARLMTLLCAAAAAVDGIDTAHAAIDDLEDLDRECRIARRDGFAAKLAIHPSQVPVINAAFALRA